MEGEKVEKRPILLIDLESGGVPFLNAVAQDLHHLDIPAVVYAFASKSLKKDVTQTCHDLRRYERFYFIQAAGRSPQAAANLLIYHGTSLQQKVDGRTTQIYIIAADRAAYECKLLRLSLLNESKIPGPQ